MTSTLVVNDDLVEEAREAGKHSTKEEAVTEALREYVSRRKQMRIVELFGTIDYDPAYYYKEQRGRS